MENTRSPMIVSDEKGKIIFTNNIFTNMTCITFGWKKVGGWGC